MGFIHELAWHQTGRVPLVQHRHTDGDSLELIQVVAGSGTALVGDKTYPLLPGMLLMIDAAVIHAINPNDEERYCRNKLIVNKSALCRALEAIDGEQSLMLFRQHGGGGFFPGQELAEELDDVFHSLSEQRPWDNGAALCAFLRMLQLAEGHTEAVPSQTDQRISQILQYLNSHYAEPLTVEQVASETLLSKYYLCHLFRAHTGMTIMQYLNEQRLTSARRLLSHTNRPVAEIAQDCGFGSSSRFCTLFREREGITPKEYRRKNRVLTERGAKEPPLRSGTPEETALHKAKGEGKYGCI